MSEDGEQGGTALVANASNFLNISRRPQLDAELQDLVRRYGAGEVRKATARVCKLRKGRKPEADWLLLKDVIVQDATDWLDGRDPYALRSNNSIARDFAEKHRGQSRDSTHRRIMGKLSKLRTWMFLARAFFLSQEARPFADHLRAAKAFGEVDAERGGSGFALADLMRGKLERYRERHGEPRAEMTMREIENAVDSPINALLGHARPRGGLFGLSRG